jgi:hypothetical protein
VQPHVLPDAGAAPPELADLSVQAVTAAAYDLGLDPTLFAGELAQGEIGLLVRYLDRAVEHVSDVELRESMLALLHRLTDWTVADGE